MSLSREAFGFGGDDFWGEVVTFFFVAVFVVAFLVIFILLFVGITILSGH
jgi:hypothetical protein